MKSIQNFQHIYLCRKTVDGRKHINTLAALVETELGRTPFDGSLFVFLNKGRDVLKMLYFDRTGFALWLKRLEKDRFKWIPPQQQTAEVMLMQPRQLELLLDGYDIFRMKAHDTVRYNRTV